jgi:hypothetical protein
MRTRERVSTMDQALLAVGVIAAMLWTILAAASLISMLSGGVW